LGKFKLWQVPYIFYYPIIDEAAIWLDMRVRTTFFTAEKTLTKDNVPVNVDAVMFWVVTDPMKASWKLKIIRRPLPGQPRPLLGYHRQDGIV
jgi:regulator of protease activity HflC (stomatin/prohibitin superfamily)